MTPPFNIELRDAKGNSHILNVTVSVEAAKPRLSGSHSRATHRRADTREACHRGIGLKQRPERIEKSEASCAPNFSSYLVNGSRSANEVKVGSSPSLTGMAWSRQGWAWLTGVGWAGSLRKQQKQQKQQGK